MRWKVLRTIQDFFRIFLNVDLSTREAAAILMP